MDAQPCQTKHGGHGFHRPYCWRASLSRYFAPPPEAITARAYLYGFQQEIYFSQF
jgi:hypothetical protein